MTVASNQVAPRRRRARIGAWGWESFRQLLPVLTIACGTRGDPTRELFRLQLDMIARVRVPDSLQFVGVAVDSSGETILAWDADHSGSWLFDRVEEAKWEYRAGQRWAGTVGVLGSLGTPAAVVVDSAGEFEDLAASPGANQQVDRRPSALLPRDDRRARVVAAQGTILQPVLLVRDGGELTAIVSGVSSRLGRDGDNPGPPPLLVARDAGDDAVIVSRRVDQPILRVRRGKTTALGTSLADARALRQERLADTSKGWVVASAIDVAGGLLLTVADLKSDKRILVRMDDRGVVRGCRRIASPYAIVAKNHTSNLAVAGAWDQGSWILLYRIRRTDPYPDVEADRCDA